MIQLLGGLWFLLVFVVTLRWQLRRRRRKQMVAAYLAEPEEEGA